MEFWTKESLEELEKCEVMYFLLASFISADSNITTKEIEENLNQIKGMMKVIPETSFSDEKKKEYLDYLKKGIQILERDLKEIDKEEFTIPYEKYSGWNLVKENEKE